MDNIDYEEGRLRDIIEKEDREEGEKEQTEESIDLTAAGNEKPWKKLIKAWWYLGYQKLTSMVIWSSQTVYQGVNAVCKGNRDAVGETEKTSKFSYWRCSGCSRYNKVILTITTWE